LRTQSEALRYSQHLVAYLDILGFSAICSRSEGSGKRAGRHRKQLHRIFEVCSKAIESLKSKQGKSEINSLVISDSIFMSQKLRSEGTDPSDIANFLLAAGQVQYNLSLHGFWTRGGISCGELSFDDKRRQIIGPALIRAVELERKSAKYPRIVVDPKLMKLIMAEDAQSFRDTVNNALNESAQRPLFVWEKKFDDVGDPILPQDVPFFIDFLRSEASTNVREVAKRVSKELSGPIEYYEKYRWLADYCIISAAKNQPRLRFVTEDIRKWLS
jgi:hypothetical protein